MSKLARLFFCAAAAALLNACSSDPELPADTGEQPDPEPELPAQVSVAAMTIDTRGVEIASKEEYVGCSVEIADPDGKYNFSGEAEIRGRGNSTWFWYPKKPYRIKLKEKASLLGMGKGKSWVLLANYRDPTDLMNLFVFELGRLAGLPYTNHSRFVELTLNGDYQGLYQFTEQVQQGSGRVDVDKENGYLISLDVDDGPQISPSATDNFWSEVYAMPVCVKNPEDITASRLAEIRREFGTLEKAIRDGDYAQVQQLLDVPTFIDFLLIQELVYNVELVAPRSMYMHKDAGGRWAMGPLWDFDAGYDFDWSEMYTGHRYFADYKSLVMGTNPATHAGSYDNNIPRFFTDLFKVAQFVEQYKARWTEVKELIPVAWENTMLHVDLQAMERDFNRWPISPRFDKEIPRMESWLMNRTVIINQAVKAYPQGTK